MVKSVLDPEIEYTDVMTIDKSDIGLDAVQFQLELFPNTAAVIALGNVKYTYSAKNILYVPVYLIKDGEVVDQFGVYEFLASNYTQLIDEDGDLDIDQFINPLPLYYSFFNEKFLKSKMGDKLINLKTGTPQPPAATVTDLTGDLGELEDEEVGSDEWTSPNKPTVLEEILGDEESKGDAQVALMNQEMKEREIYKIKAGDSWIKKFMKNGSYSLLDNEGGGDCLFAIIRDAFKDIPRDLSVAQLRKIVSDAADETALTNFREHYVMYSTELRNLTARQVEIRDKMQLLKVQFETAPSREDKLALANEGNKLRAEFKKLTVEKKHARELIHEFKWLKGVDSVAKLKAKIKTCAFWAEGWAINILEKALNIKLVILSSENYKRGDIGNVLQCGDMVDDDIKTKGSFKPKHYIIASYRGDHYLLVKYNEQRIFNFQTLPPSIKQMIFNKCVESKGEGMYNMIPEFAAMKSSGSPAAVLPATDSGAEDIEMPKEEKRDEGYDDMKSVTFDPDVVFQFYSKSSNKPKPGKGAGEKITKKKALEYAVLAAIPNWRTVLSNFYETKAPIVIDGMNWLSVENYYQGSKFKKNNPEFYAKFALDSDSEIAKSPALAKAAGGKSGKFKGKLVRPKTVKIDPAFFTSKENERAMYRAQLEKYKSDPLAKQVLLATKNAKLQHFVRGQPPIVFYDTMKIRGLLRKTS